jgi:hypothetical protein
MNLLIFHKRTQWRAFKLRDVFISYQNLAMAKQRMILRFPTGDSTHTVLLCQGERPPAGRKRLAKFDFRSMIVPIVDQQALDSVSILTRQFGWRLEFEHVAQEPLVGRGVLRSFWRLETRPCLTGSRNKK